MMRSVAAVVAGYLVFGVSSAILFAASGQDPHAMPGRGFLFGSIAYGAGFSALAGYVAARLAPARALLHAVAVAVVIGVIAAVSLVVEWNAGSIWSELIVIAFGALRPYWAGTSEHAPATERFDRHPRLRVIGAACSTTYSPM